MAAKRNLPKPSLSTNKKTADKLLSEKAKTFNSDSKPIREEATGVERDRAVHIIERATKMKTAKNIYSSRWYEYERVWKMLEEERPEDEKWRANLPDTFAYSAIKTAQAAFIDSEVVPVFSKNQDEDLNRANDMRDLYTDISKKGDQRFQLYLARQDAFKLGTAFLMVYHEKDTRVRWEIDKYDPATGGISYTRKLTDVFNDPKTVRISPYLVLIDEQTRADFKGTARDAIIIEIISRDEAKLKYAHLVGGEDAFDKRVPTTQNIRSIATAELQNRGVATTANNNTRDVSAHVYTFFAPIEIANDMVEILHYYCVRPEDSYELLINGQPIQVKTKSYPSPIPFIHKEIPLVPIRYSLYSGDEFWGAGIIELSRAETKANRENREMMSDRQRLSLFSPVFSDVTDEIDQKQLKLKPLSIIRTRGGVPHQYKIPGVTSGDFQMLQEFQASIKRVTGIDESLLGGGGGGQSMHRYTATAISFIRQMAFLRLKDFQFLYKSALIDEVRLKLKLFEQYYSNPLTQAKHLKDEPGLQQLAAEVKEFAIKTGDVYTKKKVSSTLFTGPIEDIDLEEEVLMPLTPAELITKWSQVIRDVTPFVQAGIVDLDMEKILTEYLDALRVNINKIRKEPDADAILMADGEHGLLIAPSTSKIVFDKLLKDGTPPQYLTATHLKRHQQLLDGDDEIDKAELGNLIAHIKKDTENYQKKMIEEAQAGGADMDKFGNSPLVAGIGAPGDGTGVSSPKPPSMAINYKDVEDPAVRQAMEEAAGLHGGSHASPATRKKAPTINVHTAGAGARPPASQQVAPVLPSSNGQTGALN